VNYATDFEQYAKIFRRWNFTNVDLKDAPRRISSNGDRRAYEVLASRNL